MLLHQGVQRLTFSADAAGHGLSEGAGLLVGGVEVLEKMFDGVVDVGGGGARFVVELKNDLQRAFPRLATNAHQWPPSCCKTRRVSMTANALSPPLLPILLPA